MTCQEKRSTKKYKVSNEQPRICNITTALSITEGLELNSRRSMVQNLGTGIDIGIGIGQ